MNQDGELGHLIGISEPEERTPMEAISSLRDPTSRSDPMPITCGRSPSSSGSCASSASENELVSLPSNMEEISFWIRDDEDYTILGSSIGFTALSGPVVEGQKLLSWILEKKRHAFMEWIQGAGNHFLATQLDLFLSPPTSGA